VLVFWYFVGKKDILAFLKLFPIEEEWTIVRNKIMNMQIAVKNKAKKYTVSMSDDDDD
jgi:hypothetical protein